MSGIFGAFGRIDARVRESVSRMRRALPSRAARTHETHDSAPAEGGPGFLVVAAVVESKLRSDRWSSLGVDGETGTTFALDGELDSVGGLSSSGAGGRARDLAGMAEGYRIRGTSSFAGWEGAFAVAVGDARSGRLVLTRDRMGGRPLYYGRPRSAPGTLFFASQVRELLALDLFDRRVDAGSLATFLWNGYVVGPGTIVEGIRSVPPGTALTFALESLDRPDVQPWGPLPEYHPREDGPAALASALENAVRRQMPSDRNAGCFLSGGIDSSAIVALACRAGGGRVRTFSVGFEEAEFDESVYARSVADALDTDHTEFRLTPSIFAESLPDALDSLDQPTFDALNTFFVCRSAADAGIDVALGGTGGDDLFGGNRTFRDIPRTTKVGRVASRAPRFVRSWASSWIGGSASVLADRGFNERVRKLPHILSSLGRTLPLYQLSYGLYAPERLRQLCALCDDASLALYGIPRERFDALARLGASSPLLYRIALLELSLFVADRLLRDIDSVSRSNGIEVRSPLLDDAVIRAWSAVDVERSFLPLGEKRVLREAALGDLDPALFERPKLGFVLPLQAWSRDRVAGEIGRVLLDAEHVRACGLEPGIVAEWWRGYHAGKLNLYWSRIWSLFVYLSWCRKHGMSLSGAAVAPAMKV